MKTSSHRAFSIAMFDYQKVNLRNFILLTGQVCCPKVRVWCEYVQWTVENKQSDDELSVLARACRMAASPRFPHHGPPRILLCCIVVGTRVLALTIL